MGHDGRTLVTRTSFRFLQTLYNLGARAGAQPDGVLVAGCPTGFKDFAAKVSIDTSAIQYENDELMRPRVRRRHGDRLLRVGDAGGQADAVLRRPGQPGQDAAVRHQRRPRRGHRQAGRPRPASRVTATSSTTTRSSPRSTRMMDWLAETYVNALNVIHYMHDKYAYERLEMALHDYPVERTLACGIAGLSVAADSPVGDQVRDRVRPIRDDTGLVVDYEIDGELPDVRQQRRPGRRDRRRCWSNSSWRRCATTQTYRNAEHTQSVLTITSNVVYGKHTGNTPDGRRAGEPFAPGANPMHGRDTPWSRRRRAVGGQAAVRRRRGRDLADRDRGAPGAGQDDGRAGRQAGRHPRRLHRRATASTSTSTCSTATRCWTRWTTRRSTRS